MGYAIHKDLTTVNKGAKGTNKPQWIIFHFVGASGQAKSNANYFRSTYRGASAHYFVDPTTIEQVVEDDTPAWHIGDGSKTNSGQYNGYKGYGATNTNSIGIELCQDTTTGNDVWHWDFNPETLKRAEWLIREKQKQYNIPDSRVIRHYDASGKLCPGNWQWNNWSKWYAFKRKLAGVADNTPVDNNNVHDGKPTVNGKTYLVKAGDTLSAIAKKHGVTLEDLKSWNDLDNPNLIFPETHLFVGKPTQQAPAGNVDKLAQEVIAGKHGNGEARKKSLGSNYNEVMGKVNAILTGNSTVSKSVTKSIDTLVKETLAGVHGNGEARKKSLGSNYNAVMAKINGTSNTGNSKTIDTLVRETLAGVHGNGEARKKSLGSNYNAVMAKINGTSVSKPVNKSIDTLVKETLAGVHGNGEARKKSLGSNYNAVMAKINGTSNVGAGKSIDTLVKETLAGVHGNGEARKKSLGSNYNAVMARINGK